MSSFIESVDRSEAWRGISYLWSRGRLISPSLTLFEWFAGLALLARSVTEESAVVVEIFGLYVRLYSRHAALQLYMCLEAWSNFLIF